MNDDRLRSEAELDAWIVRSLERLPAVSVPDGFAARVAAKVPAYKAPRALKATHYGRNALWAGMALLLVALFALVPAERRSIFWLAMEWLVCAQFLGLGMWWTRRQRMSN